MSYSEFPLGGMTKERVRELARSLHLPVADKPDSQEICFVPGDDYKNFLSAYQAEQGHPLIPSEGEMVDTEGHVVAHHGGVHNFTVGQRKGLGVATGSPLYVLKLDAAANRVTVGGESELMSASAEIERVNWIAWEQPAEPFRAEVKIRYRHTPFPATVTPLEGGRARIEFDAPQRAITPGQAAVCYRGDLVLGGGWIR
jgi:tRNA-specific 2-thiouridylase